jgi:hypothetical protein
MRPMALIKQLLGKHVAPEAGPPTQLVEDTRRAMVELELSQEPLRKALEGVYPFTGPLHTHTVRKRGSRVRPHRPPH